ncbi:unnamed protein product, partial [Staurois parvus]
MRGNQRVSCVLFHIMCCVCALHSLYGCAMQSHTKQCAGADRRENYIVYIQTSLTLVMLSDHRV